MFTGIIEEVGTVRGVAPAAAGSRFRISARAVLEDSREGSSIAVNGVCLTAVELSPDAFSADISPETLERSTLRELRAGSAVNLERPLAAGGRLGGHLVQGHIDGTGEVVAVERLGGDNWWLSIRVPPELDRYLVYKGSVALDGISLTVAAVEDRVVSVTVVPHTWRSTTLQHRRAGDAVNIECDVLAKYVEKLLGRQDRPAALTLRKLEELGY